MRVPDIAGQRVLRIDNAGALEVVERLGVLAKCVQRDPDSAQAEEILGWIVRASRYATSASS
jgi:hypothetical protein